MTTSDFVQTILIILIYLGLYSFIILNAGIKNVKRNWAKYRCSPVYMPLAGVFGHNTAENFSYCIQNMQTSYMGELLKPVHYNLHAANHISHSTSGDIQSIRAVFDKIRDFISHIVHSIMSIFMNIIIEFLQIVINIKGLFTQFSDAFTVSGHILESSSAAVESAVYGPPGNEVKQLCFHPDTLVKTYNNKIIKMKNIKSGDKLKNGKIVVATMNIHNLDENNNFIEQLYSIDSGESEKSIIVSGSHLIFNNKLKEFVRVKDYYNSNISNINSEKLCCLITADHTIPLGNHIFHDWEDNQSVINENSKNIEKYNYH